MSPNPIFSLARSEAFFSGARLWLLARAVWLEAIRRKNLWVMALLMGVYLAVAIAARIVRGDSQAEGQFIFNLGLSVSFCLPAVLTAMLAARVIPAEIDAGTIFPLLAKPVHRSEVIVGKFVAVSLVGVGALIVFVVLAWLVFPWQAVYSLGLFFQCVALQMTALMMLASLTICVTIWAPPLVALVVSLGLYFASGPVLSLIVSQASQSSRALTVWLCAYAPNFSQFDLSTRFTQAGPALAWFEFSGLLFSALVFISVFLYVATWGFSRRAL